MKNRVFSTIAILTLLFLLSFSTRTFAGILGGHIPIAHKHPPSDSLPNCYGYAQGRAFQKLAGDIECDPVQTYAYQIYESYFPYTADVNLSQIRVGDIVVFGSVRNGGSGHAALVVEVPSPLILNNIRVDQIPGPGGLEQKGVLLSTVKVTQGNPVGYHRFTGEIYVVIFKNSFNAGILYAGKNKEGGWITVASGLGRDYVVGQQIEMAAIDRQYIQDPANQKFYYQVFKKWQDDQFAPIARTISVTGNATYTAEFKKEFNIKFQNCYIGGAVNGKIKVNNVEYDSPSNFAFEENNAIQAEALSYQVVNNTAFTFVNWGNDGSTSLSRTFTPTDHTTYTVNYSAKPFPVQFGVGSDEEGHIQLVWSDHPNSQVTQYQIWRMVKPYGGSWGAASLLTTVGRGEEGYTDYQYYLMNDPYPNKTIKYDVRAYLQPSAVYADENWQIVYGNTYFAGRTNDREDAAVSSAVPTVYGVQAFPNPFNPSTTITYALPEPASIKLEIYDLTGRKISVLADGMKSAGLHSAVWQGKDQSGRQLASGVYLYHYVATPSNGTRAFTKSGKLLLAK